MSNTIRMIEETEAIQKHYQSIGLVFNGVIEQVQDMFVTNRFTFRFGKNTKITQVALTSYVKKIHWREFKNV